MKFKIINADEILKSYQVCKKARNNWKFDRWYRSIRNGNNFYSKKLHFYSNYIYIQIDVDLTNYKFVEFTTALPNEEWEEMPEDFQIEITL